LFFGVQALAAAPSPQPRADSWWTEMHARLKAQASAPAARGTELLYLGDSITEFWGRPGALEVWQELYGARHAAYYGIGGDRPEHLLWRLRDGELGALSPRAIVLLIGTNSLAKNSAEEIRDGVRAVLAELRARFPQARVLLMNLFPRGADATDPLRARLKAVNALLPKLADGRHVVSLDIGASFVHADGKLRTELMPDLLHLSPAGYRVWARAVDASLKRR
jgi:lysophospholipase L1-like esterase